MEQYLVPALLRGTGDQNGTTVCMGNVEDAESLQCRLEDFFARRTDGRTDVLDTLWRISWNAQDLEEDPPMEITVRMEVQRIDRSVLNRVLQCTRRAVARNVLLLLLEPERTGGSNAATRRKLILQVVRDAGPAHPRMVGFVGDLLWAVEEAWEMQQTLAIHDTDQEITVDSVIMPLVRMIYDDWAIPHCDAAVPLRGSAFPTLEEHKEQARQNAPRAHGVFPPPQLARPESFVDTLRTVGLFLQFRSVLRRMPLRVPWVPAGGGNRDAVTGAGEAAEPGGLGGARSPGGAEWAFDTWLGRLTTIPPLPDQFGTRSGSVVSVKMDSVNALSENMARHGEELCAVFRRCLEPPTRHATLQWIRTGLLAHRERPHGGFMRRGSSTDGNSFAPASTLHQLAWVLLRLCQPLASDVDRSTIARISIRYASQARPASCSSSLWEGDPCLSPVLLHEGGGSSNGNNDFSSASANRFVDKRNPARQKQFAARLQRIAQELAGESAVRGDGSDVPGPRSPQPLELESSRDSASREGIGTEPSEGESRGATETDSEERWNHPTALVWLTARAMHVGPWASWKRRTLIRKEVEKLKREQIQLRSKPRLSPAEHKRLESIGKIFNFAEMQSAALSLGFMNASVVRHQLQFYHLLAAVVLNSASRRHPSGHAASLSSPLLPLPMPSREWAGLPEHCVADVAECLIWVRKQLPARDVAELPLDIVRDLLGFCVTFLASPLHVTNPLLRFRLVEAIHGFVPFPYDREMRAKLLSGRIQVPAVYRLVAEEGGIHAMQSLGPALLRFFVDAETTGTHTQFYDRFVHRSVVFDILDYVLLSGMSHRSAIRAMGDRGTAESTLQRFASCLVNDIMHHGTSVGEHLEVIRAIPASAASPEDKKRLRTETARAKQSLTFLSRMLRLLALVTAPDVRPQPFLSDLMRDRVAQLLSVLAAGLTEHGPERFHFTVGNPSHVGLRRSALVALVGQVLGNLTLATEQPRDGTAATMSAWVRSFLRAEPFFFPGALDDLARAMQGDFVRAELVEADAFAAPVWRLCGRIRKEVGHALTGSEPGEEESAEGDVPDEFLDALLYTVMEDPVYLPPSTMVVDWSTISRHLLDSDLDPFTRDPLRLEEVVPQPELRERIQRWKRQTAEAKRRSDEASSAASPRAAGEPDSVDSILASIDDGLLREAARKAMEHS